MCFCTRFGRVRWSNTWARLQIRLTNFYMIQFQLSHISRLYTNVNSLWINNIECSLTQAKWICWKIVLCAVPGTLSLGSFLLLENLHASKYHIGYTRSKKKGIYLQFKLHWASCILSGHWGFGHPAAWLGWTVEDGHPYSVGTGAGCLLGSSPHVVLQPQGG